MSETSVPETRPPGKGWRRWPLHPTAYTIMPYRFSQIEYWRPGWGQSYTKNPYDIDPTLNVVSLWWRPAGGDKADD